MKNLMNLSVRFGLRFLMVVLMMMLSAQVQGAIYPGFGMDVGPTTSFPASFSDFNPPIDVNLEALDGTPEVYEFSRDNNAGETMIITGENFSRYNQTYSDETDVKLAALNDVYAATFRLNTVWSTDTRIEIQCSSREIDGGTGMLFYVGVETAAAAIYLENGRWKAKDGAAGTIDLGPADHEVHTFVYDSQNQLVSLDGVSHALKGRVSGSGGLFFSCNSPGYQVYPMNFISCKLWKNGVLVEDISPTIDGTIVNQVNGTVYSSLNMSQGLSIPLSVDAVRTVSYSGEDGSDTSFIAYASGVTNSCSILRMDEGDVAITLPESLPSDELYLIWPGNEIGYGMPIVANRAEAWWVGPDQVSVGKTFSVFGRNLGEDCHIYVQELDLWLASISSNPYAAEFRFPTGTANGVYTVWVHNGKGREYGWAANKLSVEVKAPYLYSGQTINVKNYASVADAVNASSPGDTIYFPAGTYSLNYVFSQAVSGRKLLGDGIDVTILKPTNPHMNNGILFDDLFRNLTVSKMTIAGTAGLNGHIFRFSGDNNTFDQVKITAFSRPAAYIGSAPFNFINNTHLTFKDCIIVNAGDPGNLDIGSGSQIFLDGCEFIGSKKCSIMLTAWGLQEASVQNCTARPYDDTQDGWFDGRWFVTADYWGAVNNIYFAHNQSTDLAPPKGHGLHVNTGEQVLIEGGMFKLRENVASATADTVTFASLPADLGVQNVVTIVEGRGYGQTRMIKSINRATGTLTLSEPWRTAPDGESFAVVAATTYRFVVHDNDLDGKEDWVTGDESTASAGVASFGGSVDLVVDGNRFTDLRKGIYQWPLAGLNEGVESVQACFFNTFNRNLFSNCWLGLLNKEDVTTGFLDGGILATTVRGNRFEGITTGGVLYDTQTHATLMKMSVYEKNVFNNCVEFGVKDDLYVENQLFLRNSGTNLNSGVALSLSYNHLSALRGNNWVGYVEDYKRGPSTELFPEHLLELPIRVVDANQAGTSEIPIWNLVPYSLNWSASTENEWIVLGNNAGTIAGQNDEDILSFTIDQTKLSAASGMVTGRVVVASENGVQKKAVTVVYENTDNPVLTGISFAAPAAMDENSSVQLYCMASYTDGTTIRVDPVWETTTYASVNESSRLTIGEVASAQTITVTATYGGLAHSTTIAINNVSNPLYTVTYLAGGNGSLSGTLSQSVLGGGNSSAVQAIPDSGYHFVRWEGDISSAENPLQLNNVISNMQLTAIFSENHITGLSREVWYAIPGEKVNLLTSDARYPASPDVREVINSFEAPADHANNFGSRMHGFIIPPFSGNYTFWVAGDDDCELWLSSDEFDQNSSLIASVRGWTNPYEWDKYSTQESAIIFLEAGRRYYVRALHKEGVVGDHLAVAWSGPGIEQSVVSGAYLEPYESEGALKSLEGLEVQGLSSLDAQASSEYSCRAIYSDGTTALVRPDWSIMDGPAQISAEGVLIADDVQADETALVLASYGDQSGVFAVSIKYVAPVVTGISIEGPDMIDESSTAQLASRVSYSDGTAEVRSVEWSADGETAFMTPGGVLVAGDVLTNELVTVTASLDGMTATHEVTVRVAEDQVIYPLSGYEGRTIRAEIYDDVDEVLQDLGELESPTELIIENFIIGRWYWLTIREYDESDDEWVKVQENWISM